jgi:hypothetical protein
MIDPVQAEFTMSREINPLGRNSMQSSDTIPQEMFRYSIAGGRHLMNALFEHSLTGKLK